MDKEARRSSDLEGLNGRRLLIVDLDAEPLFTHALQKTLEEEGLECAVVRDEDVALEQVERQPPDAVVLALDSPRQRVAALGGAIREKAPGSAIIILGSNYDARVAGLVMKNGFAGYLTKEITLSGFIRSVGLAVAGNVVLAPELSRRRSQSLSPGQLEALRRAEQLTRREQEVLELLAQGADGKQIERKLLISSNTVRGHVQNVLTKLQVHSRLEAATFSRRFGIDDLSQRIDEPCR